MKTTPILPCVMLAALATAAQAQQSAHVHGIATLNLVYDRGQLQIEFVSPADNIVGFEHEAESSAEREAIKAAITKLENAGALFDLPASAGCELHEAKARHSHDEHDDHGHDDHGHEAKHDDHGHDDHGHEAKHDDHGHDDHGHEAKHDDHGHDDHGHEAKHDDHDDHAHDKHGGEHSEFHAEYHFECNGSPIETVGLRLFETWPRIEKIQLQALAPTGQVGGDIEANDPVIRLK